MKCKYVPVKPTSKMIIAGFEACKTNDHPTIIYAAMLAAVPIQFNGIIGGLTGRQAQLYQFLIDWWKDDPCRPSPVRREIQAATGWGSSSVYYVLNGLQERGFITRERNRHRSIKLNIDT